MQRELQAMQPRLIETSRETEELIKVIERETVDVEEKKALVEIDEAEANKTATEAEAIKVPLALITKIIDKTKQRNNYYIFGNLSYITCSFITLVKTAVKN